MHQTSTGTKKKNIPATTQKWTHSSWKFYFFVFGACAGLVHLYSGLFFCFFWCLCRFGDSDFTKHWQATKKQKKKQPLDAPNIDRHQKKKSSNYSEVDP